ncbi:DUF4192 family protein [Herbiconiux sp. KACC 21604]|uniref:DUF4192 family protein n=1 Tax=unclassified Herbiconiux TaxID=2618217 RepID=UPI001491A356|nr:DUF4192 family protein [Herbiconiux sp. SALV-R1]QJU53241.1 DUF4192 family protein [Herbiconiux sp. SALV-R1]WPO88199.1 DUF4192 family protein [Herbiconiux sp. KACC 21604]
MTVLASSPPPPTAPFVPSSRRSEVIDEVERVLGYRPENSLVLRLRRGARPAAVLRVDLPGGRGGDAADVARHGPFAREVAALSARVRKVVTVDVVVFGCIPRLAPPGAHEESRLEALAAAVRGGLADAGYPIGWSVCVSGVEMALPMRATPRADPHHGPFVPLRAVSDHKSAPGRASLAPLDGNTTPADSPTGKVAGETPAETPACVVAALRAWRAALRASLPTLTEARCVALSGTLCREPVRDSVLVLSAWGFDAALTVVGEAVRDQRAARGRGHDALARLLGMEVPAGATDGVCGGEAAGGLEAPEPWRVRRAVEVLRTVAESSPGGLAAAPLTILGWLEWSRGRGSAAGAYLDLARAADPGYTLALGLSTLVDRGAVPGWVL